MNRRTTLLLGVLVLSCGLSGCELPLLEMGAEGTAVADFGMTSGEANFMAGRTFAATADEGAMLRSRGLAENSIAAQDALLTRDLADTQITNLLESDPTAFAELRPGGRLYASITNGTTTDAGWIRKGRDNSLYFNDGTMDKIRSDIRGDTIYHFDLRGGTPVPLSKTRIVGQGSRYEYAVWSPQARSYLPAGYGIPDTAGNSVDVYDAGGQFVGRLRHTRVSQTEVAALPRGSVPSSAVPQTGAVDAIQLVLLLAAAPAVPRSCENSNGGEALVCRERMQEVLAANTQNAQFNLQPLGNVSPEEGDDRRDPAFGERPK